MIRSNLQCKLLLKLLQPCRDRLVLHARIQVLVTQLAQCLQTRTRQVIYVRYQPAFATAAGLFGICSVQESVHPHHFRIILLFGMPLALVGKLVPLSLRKT